MYETFSIITPSFNQGKFISKTIESILKQKGDFYIDYIILDAASTDETVSVIEKYEKLLQDNCRVEQHGGLDYFVANDSGFEFNQCRGISYRWASRPDKGQSDALNQGFELAQGDMLTWLNSDDYFTEPALSVVQGHFRTSGADVVTGNSIALNDAEEPLWLQRTGKPTLYALLYCKEAPPQPATFFTIDMIRKAGGVNEQLRYTMDTDLWIRLNLLGAKFLKVHDFLAIQVYQTESKSLEGGEMFAAFQPENAKLRQTYMAKLSMMQKIWYTIRLFVFHKPFMFFSRFGYSIPRPVKDILNKIIAAVKSN